MSDSEATLTIGTRVRLVGASARGTVLQLVEPRPGWRRALVRWADADQYVDVEKLESTEKSSRE